jgi:hypothetical protein
MKERRVRLHHLVNQCCGSKLFFLDANPTFKKVMGYKKFPVLIFNSQTGIGNGQNFQSTSTGTSALF